VGQGRGYRAEQGRQAARGAFITIEKPFIAAMEGLIEPMKPFMASIEALFEVMKGFMVVLKPSIEAMKGFIAVMKPFMTSMKGFIAGSGACIEVMEPPEACPVALCRTSGRPPATQRNGWNMGPGQFDKARLVGKAQKAWRQVKRWRVLGLARHLLEVLGTSELAPELVRLFSAIYPSDCVVRLVPWEQESWSPAALEVALAHVRSMPRGEGRIRGLCEFASRLTLEEKREAFEGLLDRTLPDFTVYAAAVSNDHYFVRLFQNCPPEWGEEWLQSTRRKYDKPTLHFDEAHSRDRWGLWSREAVDRLWEETQGDVSDREPIPRAWRWLAEQLSSAQRAQAMAHIRACPDQKARHRALLWFPKEISDAECLELVVAARQGTGGKLFDQLHGVSKLLPRVPHPERRAWLEVALRMDPGYDRPNALGLLLPALEPQECELAVREVIAATRRPEDRYELSNVISALSFEQMQTLLVSPATADRCLIPRAMEFPPEQREALLLPLVRKLKSNRPGVRLERLTYLLPWLNEVTQGRFPSLLAKAMIRDQASLPRSN
jgi:hypothetical protein